MMSLQDFRNLWTDDEWNILLQAMDPSGYLGAYKIWFDMWMLDRSVSHDQYGDFMGGLLSNGLLVQARYDELMTHQPAA